MADAVHLGLAASPAAASHRGGQTGHIGRRHAGPAFHHVLAAALAGGRTPRATAVPATQGVQTAAMQVPLVAPDPARSGMAASGVPAQSDAALRQAMALEGVPQSWQDGLRFIMARESGGVVNIQNPVHSARGLFQLTAANYHLNPNGAQSFGNAVEEAQGGIRYIQQRYGTADNAVTFWQAHHWY
jgi:hypothetical protein